VGEADAHGRGMTGTNTTTTTAATNTSTTLTLMGLDFADSSFDYRAQLCDVRAETNSRWSFRSGKLEFFLPTLSDVAFPAGGNVMVT